MNAATAWTANMIVFPNAGLMGDQFNPAIAQYMANGNPNSPYYCVPNYAFSAQVAAGLTTDISLGAAGVVTGVGLASAPSSVVAGAWLGVGGGGSFGSRLWSGQTLGQSTGGALADIGGLSLGYQISTSMTKQGPTDFATGNAAPFTSGGIMFGVGMGIGGMVGGLGNPSVSQGQTAKSIGFAAQTPSLQSFSYYAGAGITPTGALITDPLLSPVVTTTLGPGSAWTPALTYSLTTAMTLPAAPAATAAEIGPGIGQSNFRTMEEFGDAVFSQYQQLHDQGYAITMQQVSQGLVQNDRTVIGTAIDTYARDGLRQWLFNEGIPEGSGQIIAVNRRLYDPLGTGLYRQPDVYIPGANLIMDGTIQQKTIFTPQTIEFNNFSGGANVLIVRPSAEGGSYGLVFH
jgi:hypothetical protein